MDKLKHILVIAVVFSLFALCAVPTHAESAQRYTPVPPEFLTIGNGVSIKPPLNTMGDEVSNFFSDYFENPYLTVVKQGTHTDYYPAATPNAPYVGADKQWSIMFIKPELRPNQGLMFTVYDPLIHEMTAAHSIAVSAVSTSAKLLIYNYDYENKRFHPPIITSYTLNNPLNFSYVIDSSHLSESTSKYPYYSKLDGSPITVNPYQVANPVSISYYDWWIGRRRTSESDTQGQIKPPLGVNPDSGGSGSSSSNTASSEVEPVKKHIITIIYIDPERKKVTASYIGHYKAGDSVKVYHPIVAGYKCTDPDPYYAITMPATSFTTEVYYVPVSDPPSSSEPTSSNTSSEIPDPDDPNDEMVTFTIHYVLKLPDGSKIPFEATPPYTYRRIKAPNNTQFKHTPPYVKGYRTTLKEYMWVVREGREVEVVYHPSNSTGDNPDVDTFFPILPFNPWEENFESNTKDPWNGFDIFEDINNGMFKPKPVEIPESLEKPSASDPFDVDIPTVSNPFEIGDSTVSNPFEMDVPTVSNPFEIDNPTVSNPFEMDVPTVSNPFEIDNPTVSNPFEIDKPTVSNPFELDVPTVSNPFEMDKPTVSNPFELDVPTVSNPFELDMPTVSNPFEIGDSTVSNPFER